MTVFCSIDFLFKFLPVFLVIYYLTPVKYREPVLLAGSYLFYASGEPVWVLLLLGLTWVNWKLGSLLEGNRKLLAAGAALDVLILCGIKLAVLTGTISWIGTLPLGISFYCFKMLSYLADSYQGKIPKKTSLVKAAVYYSLFFQITQGPIMRYEEGFSDENPRKPELSEVEKGLEYLILGLGLKVLLADRLAILWNELIKIGYESISMPLAWMGAYGYTLELYYDFWGYSLMAAGIGVMLGFPFIRNFEDPYSSLSISEFYRRWHMTLGGFFRDYVYIPLGGSRKGKARTALNLMIVWALTGLWHGGTVNFLIWGLVLGGIIVLEKFVLKGAMDRTGTIGRILVLLVIPLTWVVFAINDMELLGLYFSRLFPLTGQVNGITAGDFLDYGKLYWPYFAAGILLLSPKLRERFLKRIRSSSFGQKLRIPVMLVIFWVSVYFVMNSASNPFLYYSF